MATLNDEYKHGRGAQYNPSNKFLKNSFVKEHWDGIDEEEIFRNKQTKFIYEKPKTLVNKVDSPDVGPAYSMNPYQGCEHGCIYCYARNTHEYYGYSAGLDFESRIIVKENAPVLLEQFLRKKNYQPEPIMLSGNTDCYQPIERKMGITRKLLEVLLEFKHPVGIITKNYNVVRDIDLLQELTKLGLVVVNISITSLNNELHNKMEPRTAAPAKRLKAVKALADAGIPVRIMNAPIIPGLNDKEIPEVLKRSSENGALGAGYTMVRLNGAIGPIFHDWIHKAYPLKADKVLNTIGYTHNGKLNDSRFGVRMRGEGNHAEMVAQLFQIARDKYFKDKVVPTLRADLFKPPPIGQLELF
ncbi:MAG: PA0069 family radical SAM protein [Chitinophagales bacterium]|nr:PA0069 family radical SAM protein [Chitinophagales bacterium]